MIQDGSWHLEKARGKSRGGVAPAVQRQWRDSERYARLPDPASKLEVSSIISPQAPLAVGLQSFSGRSPVHSSFIGRSPWPLRAPSLVLDRRGVMDLSTRRRGTMDKQQVSSPPSKHSPRNGSRNPSSPSRPIQQHKHMPSHQRRSESSSNSGSPSAPYGSSNGPKKSGSGFVYVDSTRNLIDDYIPDTSHDIVCSMSECFLLHSDMTWNIVRLRAAAKDLCHLPCLTACRSQTSPNPIANILLHRIYQSIPRTHTHSHRRLAI